MRGPWGRYEHAIHLMDAQEYILLNAGFWEEVITDMPHHHSIGPKPNQDAIGIRTALCTMSMQNVTR